MSADLELAPILSALGQLLLRGEPLEIVIRAEGMRATLAVSHQTRQQDEPIILSQQQDGLTPIEEADDFLTDKDQAILAVLRAAEKPLKRTTIAARGKMNADSYFRRRFRRLMKLGKILAVPDGRYRLASSRLPQETNGDKDAEIAAAVLDAVRRSGQRMSLGELLGALDIYQRTDVKVAVQQLVHAGTLVNGDGFYGLPS